MTPQDPGQDPVALDLLRRRSAHVAEVSALTAQAMKLAQQASGIEMDMLRLEMAIGRDPDSSELVQELHRVENHAASLQEAQAVCAQQIAAAEEQVAALDRLIATAKGG